MPLDDLFVEAQRQLNVCNSCRYCAGYCPVWPALAQHTVLGEGDITHLANLCHDCQDCFTACMYTAPHEFDLNPPKIFTQVREETYRRYVWPSRLPSWLTGPRGVLAAFLACCLALTGLSYLTTGRVLTVANETGSPYEILPHLPMITVVILPSVWSTAVLAAAALRYWHAAHGRLADLLHWRQWPRTLVQSVQLRHMRGGGADCDYPGPEPGPARRRFHLTTVYGFLLSVVSTSAAAIQQELLGLLPPYPYLSVPVITGSLGGIGLLVGATGLLVLKARSDPTRGTESMRRADHGLIWALLVLAGSGELTLLLRDTVLFGPVLVLHLAGVAVAFCVAPYTKFVHWIFRMLSVYKDNLDTAVRAAAMSATAIRASSVRG